MQLPCGGSFSVGQRVARSLPERWPAARSRESKYQRFKAIGSRTGRGSLSLPLSQSGAGMDAKTRDLALLAALSLLCAGVALISDHLVVGLVFFVLGGVAGIEIALDQWQ
jgi:hypothetical protein